MIEARLFLWEQTIMPTIDFVLNALNNWLIPMFDKKYEIIYDKNSITPLLVRKENFWKLINDSDFLSTDEKKELLGLKGTLY